MEKETIFGETVVEGFNKYETERLEKLEEVKDDMMHEFYNIYAEELGEVAPYLEATWWIFNEPGMDDILEKAGDSLDDFFKKFSIKPVIIKGQEKLFLARFEFPQYNKGFKYSEGKLTPEALGFIDFLGGMPFGDIEIMGFINELSSDPDKITVKEGQGKAAPPVPDNFFNGFEEDKTLFNKMWLKEKNVDVMADNLVGTPEPQKPHWWSRINILREMKWPVPGEFVSLGVRIFPDLPWGKQGTNPFLFSGNFMDTVFYTNAKAEEIIAATDGIKYPTYKVKRRKETVIAKPSDYAEYEADDRVAILKNVGSNKQSQLWEEDEDFNTQEWVLCPISFYEGG